MTTRPRVIGAHEIRRRFVDFFRARGHEHVASAPLVPRHDPTLLFVNAGMVQFKDAFLGRDPRPYKRAVSVQRCLRAGGKHNDLDNVGFTPRHQTMFEMLGNFSFGDYFKAEAIEWAWGWLTEDLGIAPERLCVSVFDGTGESAPFDEEALELWTRYVPRERIYRYGAKDNFWAMGDTGPCGPCSEIHLYRAGDIAPPRALEQGPVGPAFEDDAYLELWNLVFMQYEKHGDGRLVALPSPSIDTGAGLERLAAVCAGVASNYETELLGPLVDRARALAGVPTDARLDDAQAAPFRVIADHARATAFLVADGVFPDRDGRSYVLRRIMRRAIRYGTRVGLDRPFFHEVCAEVIARFSDAYPELAAAAATIDEVVQAEEASFRRTLDRGLRRLEGALGALPPGTDTFPVDVAAELYDTYGFPIDLSGVIAREHSLALDEAAVEQAVVRRQASADVGKQLGRERAVESAYFELARDAAAAGGARFVGWEVESVEAARVLALRLEGGARGVAGVGARVELALDCTPFYAESGGQVGDRGVLEAAGLRVTIEDCIKPTGDVHVHRGVVTEGTLEVGRTVAAHVDGARRAAIRRNHSATHLLHHALRTVLGAHVTQKGSLVAPERLRFDFSHGRPLTRAQWRSVESLVNAEIVRDAPTRAREMGLEEARATGALGLFGEKYGERVRVVGIGHESLELCGGTHVARTGEIGLLAIVSEGGVAQGVRRIEAVTGAHAIAWMQDLVDVIDDAGQRVHATSRAELGDRIGKVVAELKERSEQVAELSRKLAAGQGTEDAVVDVEGIKLLAKRVEASDPRAMREAADLLRDRLASGVVVLVGEREGKANLLVAVTKDLQARVPAGKLVAVLAAKLGGRGGGRPDLAQAGGPDVAQIPAMLGEVAREVRALAASAVA